MSAPGALHGSILAPPLAIMRSIENGGPITLAMAALNAAWCARFTAQSTKDIKAVLLSWSAAAATVGVVQLRIETIDATSGKPTGNLYDAADGADAFYDITPSAGTQLYTFATTPVTGLTVGAEYGIVLITTTAATGGTHTLNSYHALGAGSHYPSIVMSATDGTTRTNFTETIASIPVVSLVMDDDTEESVQFAPWVGATSNNIYTTNAVCQEITLPASVSVSAIIGNATKVGTPAGDLIAEILDTSNALVTGTRVTVDKDSWKIGASTKRSTFFLPTPVTLAAGTYRINIRSPECANSSNCIRFVSNAALNAADIPSGFVSKTTADVTASPITWSTISGGLIYLGLLLDSIPAPDFPLAGNVTEDDTTNGATGTYHEATVAQVQSGVAFGAGSALTGEYSAGGGTTVIVVED
jgi:hypothetical protein